jgi:hypothetical protein
MHEEAGRGRMEWPPTISTYDPIPPARAETPGRRMANPRVAYLDSEMRIVPTVAI